jgi:predicted dehydrogenase
MKVAIVGCGQIADAHIQEVQKISHAAIVGVCDLNRHLARQAAVRYQVANSYTDVESMLQETRPDVVHITTPPASHLFLAKIILDHGSHLYIEKPFTVNLPEAEEIADLAVKKGKLVCAGHNSVFDPAYQRLLHAYREKKLGDIVHMVAVMGYNLAGPFGSVSIGDPLHWLHRLPGGLAQNNMSHPISLLLGLMPGENIAVSAKGRRLREKQYNDCRDNFFDEIRADICAGATSADLIFSSHLRPVQNNITVFGSQCSAFASLDTRTLRYIKSSSLPGPFAKVQWSFFDAKEAGREFWRNVRDTAKARLHYFAGMHELFIRFYAAIEGKEEMPIPMSEALRVTSVMDDIIRECKKHDQNEGAQ